MIDHDPVRVHWRGAMQHLKPALDGYRSHWNRIYIGVTTDPGNRWTKHAQRGWNKMRVLYEAFNPSIAKELERDLIDYARRCNFLVEIENINPGGEGIRNDSGLHYLYVLVGNKK
jgi:GIY-YIG catalytic domain-containing protein